tara:strand:- start:61 stop:432 length:372 start_codon:yes stop_codon:yes gene_type:complete
MNVPNRRECITRTVKWGERSVHVSIGFNWVSRQLGQIEICEVFAHGPKAGSEAASLLAEMCIERSKSIQDGTKPDYFARKCVRESDGSPASISGAVADTLAQEYVEWNQVIALGAANTQPGMK